MFNFSFISQYLESQSSARLGISVTEQLAKARENPERLNDLPEVSQLNSNPLETEPGLLTPGPGPLL